MSNRTGPPDPNSCKPWCAPAQHWHCHGACCPHLHRRTQTTQPPDGNAGPLNTSTSTPLSPERELQLAAFAQGEADAEAGRESALEQYTEPIKRMAYNGGFGYGEVVSRPPRGGQR